MNYQISIRKNFSIKQILICLVTFLFSSAHTSYSQTFDTRHQIDQQRLTVDISNDTALSIARNFIRMDSTYYVGHQLEGEFLYDHASDYQGFLYAAKPLAKAKSILVAEFGNALTMQFLTMAMFTENLPRFQDYLKICNALSECYNNTDQPDKAMQMLDEMDAFHFRKDYFGVASHKAWIYHRYRVYTSKDYSFLKNSIPENEKAALDWCHIGLEQILENKEANDAWFGPTQANMDQLSIYHYLALLLTYNKQYDSSDYYYQQLEQGGIISWNNYGGLQAEIGNFSRAAQYYAADMNTSFGHMLQEPYYYLPELLIYKGATKNAIEMTSSIIQKNGSMPGFGWYNIALARSYLYDGQLDSSEYALNKAINFKEVSIGTTLTEKQYQFTTQVLKVALLNKKIQWEKLTHSNWWYSPTHLFKVISLKVQYFFSRYMLVNALGHDPDRERLVYDLFCSESTVSFDEIWDILKGFNDRFFIKKYDNYIEHDNRNSIIKYFKLFKAKLSFENGDKDEAKAIVEDLIKNVQFDPDYEKLFIARLYELAAKIYDGKSDADFYLNSFAKSYPQLVPFSGLDLKFQLQLYGESTTSTFITKTLQKTQINWTEKETTPVLMIQVQKNDGDEAVIVTQLNDKDGNKISSSEPFTINTKDEDAARSTILQHSFGIGI